MEPTPPVAPAAPTEAKPQYSFWQKLKGSIYSPQLYAEFVGERTGKTIEFFLLFALVLVVVSCVAAYSLYRQAVNAVTVQFPSTVNAVVDQVPSDLQVDIKDGHATSTNDKPVFIKFPQNTGNGELENLLVVDTKTPFTAEQFQNYHTAAWLTKDSVVYYSKYSSDGGAAQPSAIQVAPLSQANNMTFTRSWLQEQVQKYQSWLHAAPWVLAIMIAVGLYLFHAGKLVYLLGAALVLLVIAALGRIKLSYGQAYRVVILASVPVFVLQTIIRDTGHWFWPTLTTTILITVVAMVNLVRAKPLIRKEPPAPEAPVPQLDQTT